ncbi:MAG: restriction endonuclease [Chloroflexota bacterium]|nr:restriction endonuclease [Chloroflexota bacterium]
MTIPEFQTFMLPMLRLLADGQARHMSELRDLLAQEFGVTEAERQALMPSGRTRLFDNRVAWARTDLGQAGALESPSRGVVRITDRGREILADNPARVDRTYLGRYSEFQDFRLRTRATDARRNGGTNIQAANDEPTATPDESIERAYDLHQKALASEILTRVKALSPGFFEKLVVELLVAMGYGGTRRDAARVVGQSGDGGIDGEINEDRLGLDKVYVQAKRWDNSVGRPVVQAFAGSLMGRQANKGVLITTGTFTADAEAFVRNLPTRIVLIDGQQLAMLMIEHNVGVSVVSTYQMKRVDSDYFAED